MLPVAFFMAFTMQDPFQAKSIEPRMTCLDCLVLVQVPTLSDTGQRPI